MEEDSFTSSIAFKVQTGGDSPLSVCGFFFVENEEENYKAHQWAKRKNSESLEKGISDRFEVVLPKTAQESADLYSLFHSKR